MKNFLILIITSLLIFACDNSKVTNQKNSDQQSNYIQWTNGDPLHDEMIRSGIGHFLNIEREKAYVFFEKAIKLDSTSFAAHVMMSTMSLPNSEKQELHYKLAKRYSTDKNENSKRFVSLLDIKTENGYRGIWGSSKEKSAIWEKMYEAEPRGAFIQFNRAISNSDLTSRIKNLEKLSVKWGEPNNAAIINFLGYLYYRNGDKEKSKKTFEKYLDIYSQGYNSLDSMAEFYMYEKNYDEAKKYYEMVLNQFPFSNSAQTALKNIETLK
tara:strand:- start:2232 stop:3035 length:804 start_codon:yes stop_codon:yes gene_type:complete